jgi:3-isopropylmalate/(R)-2-methylmalate dehydratase small subunit
MIKPFTTLTSVAAPMLEANIDTDIIIPSREMKSTGKTGLADGLFAGRRYRPGSRDPDPDFVLNRAEYRGAAILLAGDNFGCGSSREHAVWALAEFGIRAVIAPSFSPIFAGNAVRGGVLPLVLPADAIATLVGVVSIDLPRQTVTAGSERFAFAIDAEAKAMLIGGLDAIDLTLQSADAIAAWQARDRLARPWVYLVKA